MNPWTDVGNLINFDVADLRHQVEIQLRINENKNFEEETKPKRRAKAQDYKTYNYLRNKTENKDNSTTFEVTDNSHSVESKNTLLSILLRAQERQEKRKNLQEYCRTEREKKTRERLEKEKVKNEEEKEKYKQKLEALKQEFIIKKQRTEERRENERKFRQLMTRATRHYETFLLRTYLENFKRSLRARRELGRAAVAHYDHVLLAKHFRKLKDFSVLQASRKNDLARNYYEKTILRKYFLIIFNVSC